VIRFSVVAWDANCPQHIPQRVETQSPGHSSNP